MKNIYLNFEFGVVRSLGNNTFESYMESVLENTTNKIVASKYIKILNTLGIEEFNEKFNSIINENAEVETEMDVNLGEEKEAEVLNTLLGKHLNYDITGEEEVNNASIVDVTFNFNSVELLLSDGATEVIPMTDLENFLNGYEVVIKDQSNNAAYGISLVLDNVNENLETDGSLENDIANDLFDKYKNIEKPTVKELDEDIISHGGTLEMSEKIMSYLVGLGINFEAEDMNENLNDFKQELPLQNEVNQNWNIFGDNVEKTKKDVNYQAVDRMISDDAFLNFSYAQLRTGDKEEDLKMMYDTYIKKNDDLLNKLKTYESLVSYINENLVSENELTEDIKLVFNDFNIEIDNNTLSYLLENIEKYNKIFETYYAIYSVDSKKEFEDFITNHTVTELTNLLLESGIKLNLLFEENSRLLQDKLNISETLANFIINLCLQFEAVDEYDANVSSIIFMIGVSFVLKSLI